MNGATVVKILLRTGCGHKAANMTSNRLRLTLLPSLICGVVVVLIICHISRQTWTTDLHQFQQLNSPIRDNLTRQRDDISRRLNSLQVNRYFNTKDTVIRDRRRK